jgi:hypothetical protein
MDKSDASLAAYDPVYERALGAVRRWVESMEGALNAPHAPSAIQAVRCVPNVSAEHSTTSPGRRKR